MAIREAIGTLELRLDPRRFRRIHRSMIVDLDSVRELRQGFHGDYVVVLRDGMELKLSHRFRSNLEKNSLGARPAGLGIGGTNRLRMNSRS